MAGGGSRARNQQGLRDCPSLHTLPPGTAVGQAHTAEPELKGKKEKEGFIVNTGKTGKGSLHFLILSFRSKNFSCPTGNGKEPQHLTVGQAGRRVFALHTQSSLTFRNSNGEF